MAYRQFHNEQYYEAPSTTPFDLAPGIISSMANAKRQRQDQRRNAANQLQYDLDKGAYETDQKILTQYAADVVQRAKNDMRQYGKLSMETERMMKEGKGLMSTSNAQMEREKLIRQNIVDRGTRDKYYNANAVLDKLKDAHNTEVDFSTRGKILDNIETSLDGIETFRFDDYKADYVKKIGTQSKKNEFKMADGSYKTIYDQRTFWDDAGKPGVTDQHAIRFLDSDPDGRVARWYDSKVSQQLDQEIKQMKASGDSRDSWMKDLSDAEIKSKIIDDPSKNRINNTPYGKRVRDAAKYDLNEADRINTEVSYTGGQRDTNNSGGRWTNPNILHSDTINSFSQTAKSQSTGEVQPVTTYGPGGIFTQKSGKAVVLDTTNPIRTDTQRGVTTRNNKGNVRMNLTGYLLMPVKKGMAPFALKSNNADQMIEEINNIPLDYFDPNGKVGLQPEMRIGLNGYVVNEAGVLNDVQDKLIDISAQIAEATAKGDKEKLASLQNMEYSLNELKQMVGAGDYDAQELLLAGNKAGVRKIQQDMLVPADKADIARIKNVTGGFDLNDKSFWSADMQAVSEAYNKRYQEAQSKNFGVDPNLVKSDGSDLSSWKQDKKYQVGNSVYYFDKTDGLWKKQ